MISSIHARVTLVLLFASTALLTAGSPVLGAPNNEKHTGSKSTVTKPKLKPKPYARKAKRDGKGAQMRRPTAKRMRVDRRVPMPRPRPRAVAVAAPGAAESLLTSKVPSPVASTFALARGSMSPLGTARLANAPAEPSPDTDGHALRDNATLADAIKLARRGKSKAATDRQNQIRDSMARKLVEWLILRSGAPANFARYAAFMRDNPSWPGARVFRLRAEARLWFEQCEPDIVFSFFSNQEPLGTFGKLAMARAHLTQGDRAAAQNYVRSAWREGNFSAKLESQVLRTFGSLLTRQDHRTRMQARLYTDDLATALRAAKRLGSAEIAIVKARAAVKRRAKNASALLNAVPKAARQDAAYLFTRIQWLRRSNRITQASRLVLSAQLNPHDMVDADAWWIERRILVRELLDNDKAQMAYRIAHDAALPSRESLRVDQPFTTGWIALRFLDDPDTAAKHFARIPQITTHPTSLARAGYWLGRAAETAGRANEAHRHYQTAAQQSAAYYGQLARARLGRRELPVRRPPELDSTHRAALRHIDMVRAVEMLYETDNRDLVMPFVAGLNRVTDIGVLTLIADTAAKHKDARAMLHLGRSTLVRGFDFDYYAFPTVGLPKYTSIGPKADASLVYAIARAESGFSFHAVSSAKAIGLMQVMPATGRTIARRLGIKFDAGRLRSDPVYNVQLGSAEIADLVNEYDGCHVLAFVGYNAGRGRVKQWIARYGDPRDPKVDVVDWVERIPFTETRNYVQRVMENLQIYRSHFDEAPRFTIEADMRGARG